MNETDITIKKAKRTKNGAKVDYGTGKGTGSFNFNQPMHLDLVAAMTACNSVAAALDERQNKAPRLVTCTGLVRVEAGENVGYQLTGEQPYAKAGQTQGFATPCYWVEGENQRLTADQLKKIEALEKEFVHYVAGTKVGERAQQELDLDAPQALEQPTAAPVDENVKSADKPKGKKSKSKKAKTTRPAIPVNIKNAVAKAASSLAEVKIRWSECEVDWHETTDWFTCSYGGKLFGYIKMHEETGKAYFEETQRTREDAGEIMLEGEEAKKAAKALEIPTPMILGQNLVGTYLQQENMIICAAHPVFSVQQKAWFMHGTDYWTKLPENMALTPAPLVLDGPPEIKKGRSQDEMLTFIQGEQHLAAESMKLDTWQEQRAKILEKEKAGAWSDGKVYEEFEKLEDLAARALVAFRNWIHDDLNEALSLGKLSPSQKEELIGRQADHLQALDPFVAMLSEDIDARMEDAGDDGFDDEFEQGTTAGTARREAAEMYG